MIPFFLLSTRPHLSPRYCIQPEGTSDGEKKESYPKVFHKEIEFIVYYLNHYNKGLWFIHNHKDSKGWNQTINNFSFNHVRVYPKVLDGFGFVLLAFFFMSKAILSHKYFL